MNLDSSDEEKLALADLLKRTIEANHYPLSPRIRRLKAILAKLGAAGRRLPLAVHHKLRSGFAKQHGSK